MPFFRILSVDPGIKNFAYTAFECEIKKEDDLVKIQNLRILQFGFLKEPIPELVNFDLLKYLKEKSSLNLPYKFDICVLERYQARLQGPVNEIINFNILNFIHLIKGKIKDLRLLLPTTWKCFYKIKELNLLEELQSQLKQHMQLKKILKIHHIDALCMGLYEILNKEIKNTTSSLKKKEAQEFLKANKEYIIEYLRQNILTLNWFNFTSL